MFPLIVGVCVCPIFWGKPRLLCTIQLLELRGLLGGCKRELQQVNLRKDVCILWRWSIWIESNSISFVPWVKNSNLHPLLAWRFPLRSLRYRNFHLVSTGTRSHLLRNDPTRAIPPQSCAKSPQKLRAVLWCPLHLFSPGWEIWPMTKIGHRWQMRDLESPEWHSGSLRTFSLWIPGAGLKGIFNSPQE